MALELPKIGAYHRYLLGNVTTVTFKVRRSMLVFGVHEDVVHTK